MRSATSYYDRVMAESVNGKAPLGTALLAAAILLLVSVAPVSALRAQSELPIVARVGPWPVATRLIAYDGRIWFANSVKGRNHNSADLYSVDPTTGDLRYERHLFSQDAGWPLVHNGRLYWPFEDSRISLSWGEVMRTNRGYWELQTIPSAVSYHTHALASLGDRLIAATSAWRAGLQISDDDGRTWRQLYDHPTPDRRVSRITALETLGDKVFAVLNGPNEAGLLVTDGEQVWPLDGWPKEKRVLSMAVFGDYLYGFVRTEVGVEVWRSDGETSERVRAAGEDWRPRAIAAGLQALWAITATNSSGAVWRSSDGREWTRVFDLTGGRPDELLIHDGQVYIAGAGSDGRSILWGPAPNRSSALSPEDEAPSYYLAAINRNSGNWDEQAAELIAVQSDPASYDRHARGLRDVVFRLASSRTPEGFFTARLDGPWPEGELSLIGGAVTAPRARLGRWVLLWGMALSGNGPVPVDYLREPWTAPANRSEKYFETAPAAIWAVAVTHQRDPATIDALIERLSYDDDPAWLRGDVVGALSALTGQRFAYNVPAWQTWWQSARPTSPE